MNQPITNHHNEEPLDRPVSRPSGGQRCGGSPLAVRTRARKDWIAGLEKHQEKLNQIKPCEWGVNITAGGYDYEIEWHRIDSYGKLAEWIAHLTEKVWWDKVHTPRLILVVQQHFKWPQSRGA